MKIFIIFILEFSQLHALSGIAWWTDTCTPFLMESRIKTSDAQAAVVPIIWKWDVKILGHKTFLSARTFFLFLHLVASILIKISLDVWVGYGWRDLRAAISHMLSSLFSFSTLSHTQRPSSPCSNPLMLHTHSLSVSRVLSQAEIMWI